jgi:hypothetical protein
MSEYEVGYKKPPRHSQFKPGNRTNPFGRGKKPAKTEVEIVREIINGPIEFHEDGKLKRAPRLEVIVKSYFAAALRGDVRAAEMLLTLRAKLKGNLAIEPCYVEMTKRDMSAA